MTRQAPLEATQLGYPILVKASAGGGGKGMRIVVDPTDLLPALQAGAREAQQAFGDATLMLEKYVERPRHVEIQVLGDQHGHRVHLFERECSIQRRHQKIVEETPSTAVNPPLRERMTDAALRLAAAVDYTGAGTVEFLLGPDGQFYFLEMNTRLQVEHPITEMVTGIDLVHQQLRIAQGQPLGFAQEDLVQRGHAIECRLYAEDPARGFLPCTGTIAVLREPDSPGCRIDSGIAVHTDVTPYYDPILSKLITYGDTRDTAILRMQALLREYTLLGVTTNRQFLLDILASGAFTDGDTDTGFLERYFADWQPAVPLSNKILAVAALGETLQRRGRLPNAPALVAATRNASSPAPATPWQHYDGWRIGGTS
jgi:acetyl/propionyl-CoA carboxylase alpha subunit